MKPELLNIPAALAKKKRNTIVVKGYSGKPPSIDFIIRRRWDFLCRTKLEN